MNITEWKGHSERLPTCFLASLATRFTIRSTPNRDHPAHYLQYFIMNNNLYNFNSSSYNINNTNRFSPKQNSPRLNDTSNTISFASLNIRGINDICKFDDILDDLITENISII